MAENLENERKSAKMEADLVNIKELLLDIKDELKGLNQTYVPRTEIVEMFRSRDEQYKEIKANQNSAKHLLASWAAVAVAAIAILVAIFK